MIAIDTNIFVRSIMQDEPIQSAKASAFLGSLTGENRGYLTLVTLAELFWVLDRRYKLPRHRTLNVIHSLLAKNGLTIENELAVVDALTSYQTNTAADFSDCLISRCAIIAGCDSTYTFDKGAARSAGMTLLA